MEPDGSLSYSKKPATGPRPQPDEARQELCVFVFFVVVCILKKFV